MKFPNYSYSFYVVEVRFGSSWKRVASYSSKGMAKIEARLTSEEYPLHSVRMRLIECGE